MSSESYIIEVNTAKGLNYKEHLSILKLILKFLQ